MTTLPKKPAAVAHVSDALWEAALIQSATMSEWGALPAALLSEEAKIIIDHARCIILLGEILEHVDPIEAAVENIWEGRWNGKKELNATCRKHFAGLTFPVQS